MAASVNRVWVPKRRQLTHFVLDHELDRRSFGVSCTYPLLAILSLLWNALRRSPGHCPGQVHTQRSEEQHSGSLIQGQEAQLTWTPGFEANQVCTHLS